MARANTDITFAILAAAKLMQATGQVESAQLLRSHTEELLKDHLRLDLNLAGRMKLAVEFQALEIDRNNLVEHKEAGGVYVLLGEMLSAWEGSPEEHPRDVDEFRLLHEMVQAAKEGREFVKEVLRNG